MPFNFWERQDIVIMNPSKAHKWVARDVDFNSSAFITYQCVLVSTFYLPLLHFPLLQREEFRVEKFQDFDSSKFMYLVLIKVKSFCSNSSWLFLALSLRNPLTSVLYNIHWLPVLSRYLVLSPGHAVATQHKSCGTMST